MKKKVPTEQEIAKRHGVSVDAIIKQAEIGSTVEREHVTTHEEAYGIALQHLDEFPDYYKHLLKMEKELKAQHKKRTYNEEGLRDWFGKSKSDGGKPGWVQSDGSPCANEPGETKTPKCFSRDKLASMTKVEIASAVRRKSDADPHQPKK